MFYILLGRIFQLQIVEGKKHEEEFSVRILRELPLEGTRGNIYDRYGVPLAENKLAYSITLDASIEVNDKDAMIHDLITIIEDNGDEIIKSFPISLSDNGKFEFNVSASQISKFKRNIFGSNLTEEEKEMTAEDIYNYLRHEKFFDISDKYNKEETLKIMSIRYALYLKRYYKYKPETIAININDSTLAHIKEHQDKFPGAKIVVDPLRYYPNSEYFAHIMGYTRQITSTQLEELEPHGYDAFDIVGQAGIEKEMELYLKATDGNLYVEVDNMGRTMNVIDTVSPKPGKDVFLTLDKELQMASYDALENQIAQVVQSKIISDTQKKDPNDVQYYLADVFTGLFENKVISIDLLSNARQEDVGYDIYKVFANAYKSITDEINFRLVASESNYSKDMELYTDYIIDNLVNNGILLKQILNQDNVYKYTEIYNKYRKNEVGLQEFISDSIKNEYYEESFLNKVNKDESKPSNTEIYNYINNYIMNEVINEEDFKILVYTNLVEKRRISYRNLSFLLIEQGIVNATEEERIKLSRGTLSSLTFIKDKISKLEIKPYELSLDPSSGSVVVVDVNSGEVLSLVSYPSFDNNRLVNDFDYNYFYSLLNDPNNPLFQRATKEKRAPGSTFKMLTAMAGLEEGVITPNTIIYDKGIFTKIFPPARCWSYNLGFIHGDETVADAIRDSCNYFFYEVAYRLGTLQNGNYSNTKAINALDKYISMFGLDSTSGIELPEYNPQNPERDAVRAAIGQDTNNYTPVQIARYIATVANGGTLFDLNVVDKVVNNNGEVYTDKEPSVDAVNNFKPENVKVVHKGMLDVTSVGGTAYSIFNGFPIKVAGKTGTSQQEYNRPDHATFTAFAPYENPEIAVVVVIPYGYTAQNSGKVVKEVISAYYNIYGEVEKITLDNVLD